MPHPDDPGPGHRWWETALVLGPVVVLAPLLSVWASFLVPVRVGGWPVMAWAVPLGILLVLAARAARSAGTAGVLVPALLWLAVSWFAAGSRRAEGDLVVPATLSGQLYLFGGVLLWAALVMRVTARR